MLSQFNMKGNILNFFCFFICALLNDVGCVYKVTCILESMENIVFLPSFKEPLLCNEIEKQFKHTRELLKTCTRQEINIDEYEDLVKEYCDPKSDVRITLATNWNYLQNYDSCARITFGNILKKFECKINTTSVVQKICEREYGLFATCLHDQYKTLEKSVQETSARVIHAFKCVIIGQCYTEIATESGAINNVRDDESIKKVCTKRNPDVEAISSGTIAIANMLCFFFVMLGFYMSSVF